MPDRPLITLTTDFGEGSRYVAAMKGVIYTINPAANVVDVSHSVPPQDILAGARVLAEAVRWFPATAIHVAVVDPGVGGGRRIVCAEQDGLRVVCPDNGLLTFLACEPGRLTLHAVENAQLRLAETSATFHGRDIMAPAAAHLSLGVSPEALGPPVARPMVLDIPTPRRTQPITQSPDGSPSEQDARVSQRIEGQVVEVDSFGNLITNIDRAMLKDCPRDDSVAVKCDEHETIGIYTTYSDQPPMTLVALVGSGDALELAIVDDSAKIMLGVSVGAAVVVEW